MQLLHLTLANSLGLLLALETFELDLDLVGEKEAVGESMVSPSFRLGSGTLATASNTPLDTVNKNYLNFGSTFLPTPGSNRKPTPILKKINPSPYKVMCVVLASLMI